MNTNDIETALVELRSTVMQLRDSTFATFEELRRQKQRLAEVAGWIPSLDGPLLVEACKLLTEMTDVLEVHAIKLIAAFEKFIEPN